MEIRKETRHGFPRWCILQRVRMLTPSVGPTSPTLPLKLNPLFLSRSTLTNTGAECRTWSTPLGWCLRISNVRPKASTTWCLSRCFHILELLGACLHPPPILLLMSCSTFRGKISFSSPPLSCSSMDHSAFQCQTHTNKTVLYLVTRVARMGQSEGTRGTGECVCACVCVCSVRGINEGQYGEMASWALTRAGFTLLIYMYILEELESGQRLRYLIHTK